MDRPERVQSSTLPSAPLAEMVNHTRNPAQYFQHVDHDGAVFHIVVARASFDLARIDSRSFEPALADEQAPLVEADQWDGDPAIGCPQRESDFAPFKPRCDVLLTHATGYSLDGKAHPAFPVGVGVGDWHKMIQVTGPRSQRPGMLGWSVGAPRPVSEVPIGYAQAFGGTLRSVGKDGAQRVWADERNPAGTGFAPADWQRQTHPRELRAPQIEAHKHPYRGQADYPVVGLGPIGRAWRPRRALAGTFDDAWREAVWPRLPADHDYRYWNAAPEDQQIPYPSGGETLRLVGLSPTGSIECKLPARRTSLRVRLLNGLIFTLPMCLDTLEFNMQTHTLGCVFRRKVAAARGVRKLELGTWELLHG